MKEISLDDSLLEEPQKPSGPVTCLGMTFENDEARRAHFTEELRKKLQDPEFRKIEGFPIGSDEDILNLSDPPYYTACPNPWIADFIAEWEAQKPAQPEGYHYHREPFAADVSEGKNDPIYNAHSYHTKVPHKAIMRYILHYTEPGDIVFDGFCGTGMTGVAAQLCGDRDVVMSLGYQVKHDGTILQEETDADGRKVWRPFSKLGVRKAVLNDLSPAATFIAYNYNTPADVAAFEKEAKRILKEVEEECGWMYETLHTDGKTKGKINYTVWSDVFLCPNCTTEVIFWDAAIDRTTGRVLDSFSCPVCQAALAKNGMERAKTTFYDKTISKIVEKAKQIPVLINYSTPAGRLEKRPDNRDRSLIEEIESSEISDYYPTTRIDRDIDIWYERDYRSLGVYSVDAFFTGRNIRSLAITRRLVSTSPISHQLLFAFTGILQIASRMSSFRFDARNPQNTAGGILKGALYIPSLSKEARITDLLRRKINGLASAWKTKRMGGCVGISTQSTTNTNIPPPSFDYMFFDPPFGSNIIYSDLSLPWESWLRISTRTEHEAVVHRRKKDLPTTMDGYRQLMTDCFQEAYRLLKPGRWMTVEFSNTKSSVWNSIQTALTEAGFIVANVSALDKQQGSFKAVTTPTAVKQDLVISAYKPNGGFEARFLQEAHSEEGVWDFVRTHLKYLPVAKQQDAVLQVVPERDPRILFDQMVAYYVRKGCLVPISSQEFQAGLAQRFIERDGMYFLPEQAEQYDRKKATTGAPQQLKFYVSDEASAIQWLRQLIKEKPQTFADINPQFMQQLGGWSKNEAQLDLRELLNQNFLCYDGKGPVPEQIHAYLSSNWKELRNLPKDDPTLVAKARDRWYLPDPNKAGDLEKLREKALFREFEEYKQAKKKLKVFRLEAVRAGFKKAWQERDYAVIVAVADKIPNNVLEEDPKLLMWYDQAVTRMGGE